jgi:hypothetical protein
MRARPAALAEELPPEWNIASSAGAAVSPYCWEWLVQSHCTCNSLHSSMLNTLIGVRLVSARSCWWPPYST